MAISAASAFPRLSWLLLCSLTCAVPALAQDGSDRSGDAPAENRNGSLTPPTAAAPSTEVAPEAAPDAAAGQSAIMREVAKFAEFDELRPQGQTSDFPGVYETITQDAGGFRTWLYDNNLYFRGSTTNPISYDVAGTPATKATQSYVGQRFTATQANDLRLSWKFGGSGNDITQLNTGVIINSSTWARLGPSGVRFNNLNIFSSFFDRKVEIKAGVTGNVNEFVGIFSGGNPILAAGLAASIPVSTGMSGGIAATPTFNVQLNGKRGFYSKSGIQRSIVPEGTEVEVDGSGAGLKLTRRGARPLFIQEFGVRRPASADSRQIWLRAGASYNLSRYARLDGGGRDRNWMIYALGDYQITQPDKRAAYRGVYVGASALFGDDAVNVYTRSLEARVYAIGMIPGRPADQMTFTVGANRFSRSGGRALASAGQITQRDQFSVGALYALRATNGVFVSPSITYIRNPSFIGDLKPAVNLGAALVVLF